jgi:hypothetical protein
MTNNEQAAEKYRTASKARKKSLTDQKKKQWEMFLALREEWDTDGDEPTSDLRLRWFTNQSKTSEKGSSYFPLSSSTVSTRSESLPC